ncbi:MAG TPA: PilC/PilY family type IV pilus protein [Gallionellaceae bacterium]
MDKAKTSLKGMRAIAGLLMLVAATQAWAGLTDLATAPLATSSGTSVRPNILFTLDNSGSMAWDFLPDYTGGGMGTSFPHCKPNTRCTNGLPPFQANYYNGLAYNPSNTYGPPYNFDGTFKPSMNAANTTNWTLVKQDGYGVQATGTINLVTSYPETIYCNTTGGITLCKQNGVDTYNPFFMDATGTGNPPSYAYPGMGLNFGSATGSANTLFGGWILLNQPTTTAVNLYNGPALTNASQSTTTWTLNSPTVTLSGSTVTLTYTTRVASGPTPAAPATGDLITVSGTNCSNAFTVSGKSITVLSNTQLTYAAGGTKTTNKTCGNAVVTHITTTAMTPNSIASNNVTVSVMLSSLVDASGHTMAVNDLINVSGTGCDIGYRATNALVTSVNTTTNTITYAAQSVLSVPSNTACTISRLIVTPPASPGISINGNLVTAQIPGCCSTTGTANTSDLVLRTGDYVAPFCQYGSAYNAPWVPVTVIDANTFTYTGTTGGTTGSNISPGCYFYKAWLTVAPTMVSYSTTSTRLGAPYEYQIVPVEFCDSPYLTNCVASSVPTGAFTYPAPVRFCNSAATAALPPGSPGAQLSGTTINCQGLFASGGGLNYTSVRYGLFYRVDVVNTRATYGNEVLNGTIQANGTPITFNGVSAIDRTGRTDCVNAPNCTYAEEMTNFANWYAYYKTRIQTMKTSAGKAFMPMDTRYRIGFATINESWVVPTTTTGGQWLPVAMFDLTQKQKWYNAMYSINPGNSTPLREAVARAGRYFAKKYGLPGDPITDDPVEFSCQQNYLLITTDGYWNGTTSNVVDLAGAQIGNVDNNASNPYTTRAEGVYDGGVAGASTTLADTAAYYYLTDLRTPALGNCSSGSTTQPGNTLCSATTPDPYDNVPAGGKDPVSGGLMWQHMVTYSLGLANGLMLYQPNYETATTGDVASIKSGASGCPFSGAGICNWPLPAADSPTALDDLWHAAVNGRGTFYNARDPVSLSTGLTNALTAINVQTGSAAASATSSPNITQTDRSIFSSTYRTVKWDGEVVSQLIDPVTGNVPPATITPLTQPITSIVNSSGTIAVNMASHGLATGDLVQVANTATGICDPAFNTGGQSATVAVIDANHFTYPSVNPLGASTNIGCQISKAGIAWSAQSQLDIKVRSATDPEILTRFIYTDDTAQLMPLNTTNTTLPMNGLKEFRYSLLPAADQAMFDNQCTTTAGVPIMSQCTAVTLTAAQITAGNSGLNLIDYLRGNQTLEQTLPNATYRPRDHFLGDTVNARPAYVRAPQYDFKDAVTPTYQTFQSANQTRLATIYIAANDGMLHAFDAGQCTTSTSCNSGTGNERWAYVPHETFNSLYKLADTNYGSNHQYFVDGSPEVMDIYVNAAYSTASGLYQGWHTILVGGLNGGGRGYYALDITDPSVPIGLWDVCANSVQCTVSDTDMGYTYGNPVITKRSSDGKWVVLVTSGYNNVSPGSGQGFLYVLDAITGVILQKIPTGSGSITTPSGLAKIAAYADNALQNNTSRFIYGGDLNGDVWRFDLGAPGSVPVAYPTLSPLAQRFTTLYSDLAGTLPQPITSRPELGDPWTLPGSINSLAGTGKPAIMIGTGKYLGASDLGNTQVQTIYALKDDFTRAGNTFPSAPTVPNPRSLPTATFLQGMVLQTINPATGTSTTNTVDWSLKEGWYADFPGLGERNNLDPQLVLGTLIVITNVPTAGGACMTGGTSYMYQFNFQNGTALPGAQTRVALGNAITVGFVAVRLPSGQLKVIVTNASGQKTSQSVNVSGTAATRSVSWRELTQ